MILWLHSVLICITVIALNKNLKLYVIYFHNKYTEVKICVTNILNWRYLPLSKKKLILRNCLCVCLSVSLYIISRDYEYVDVDWILVNTLRSLSWGFCYKYSCVTSCHSRITKMNCHWSSPLPADDYCKKASWK